MAFRKELLAIYPRQSQTTACMAYSVNDNLVL